MTTFILRNHDMTQNIICDSCCYCHIKLISLYSTKSDTKLKKYWYVNNDILQVYNYK